MLLLLAKKMQTRLLSTKAISFFYLMVFLYFGALTFILNANLGVFADDDNTWFYSLTYKVYDRDAWEYIENDFISVMKRDGDNEQITRLVDKRDYTYNYLLPEAIWSSARVLVNDMFPNALYYERYALYIWGGFVGAFFATLSFLFLSLSRAKPSFPIIRGLAWVAILSLLGALLPSMKPPFMQMWNFGFNIPKLATNLFWFMQDPSYSFSAFSFTGRNNFVLYMLGVFIARWMGRYRLAYVLLTFGFLFHASMAMLSLLTFFVIDLVLRPHIFKGRIILSAIFIALTYDFMIETLWHKVGGFALLIIVPIVALIVFFLRIDLILRNYPRFVDGFHRFRSLGSRYRSFSDVLFFCSGWFITAPIAIILNGLADDTQATYFWSQIHVRILSVWQPAILLSIILFFFYRGVDRVRYTFILMVLMVAGTTGVIYKKFDHAINLGLPVRLLETTEKIDLLTQGRAKVGDLYPQLEGYCAMPEALIWYMLTKDYVQKTNLMDEYIKKLPPDVRLSCF